MNYRYDLTTQHDADGWSWRLTFDDSIAFKLAHFPSHSELSRLVTCYKRYKGGK